MKARTLRKLSEHTQITRASLRRWVKLDWFPPKTAGGWDVTEVLQAVEVNVRQRQSRKEESEGDGQKAVEASRRGRKNAPLGSEEARAILSDPDSDPVMISRAVVAMVGENFSRSASTGALTKANVDNIKNALEGLRAAEKTFLDLRVRKGELIERDVAKAVIFQLGKRFQSILDVLKLELGAWLLDETEDHELKQDFEDEIARQTKEKMRLETAELEDMITTEEERQGVKK